MKLKNINYFNRLRAKYSTPFLNSQGTYIKVYLKIVKFLNLKLLIYLLIFWKPRLQPRLHTCTSQYIAIKFIFYLIKTRQISFVFLCVRHLNWKLNKNLLINLFISIVSVSNILSALLMTVLRNNRLFFIVMLHD